MNYLYKHERNRRLRIHHNTLNINYIYNNGCKLLYVRYEN